MNGKQSAQGNSQRSANSSQHDPSVTVGVGGPTSGEAGATPSHETMAETGGSGGSGLTRNDSGIAGETAASPDARGNRQQVVRTASDADKDQGRKRSDAGGAVSGARGFQDTRSEQAGRTETGLGTPETGANQTQADLDRQR
jgi:hypothetical protein